MLLGRSEPTPGDASPSRQVTGPELVMAAAAALVLVGVPASKLSARSGIPALPLRPQRFLCH